MKNATGSSGFRAIHHSGMRKAKRGPNGERGGEAWKGLEERGCRGGERNDSWGVARCHRGVTVSIGGAVKVAEFMRRRFIWAMRVVRGRPRRAAAPPTPRTRPPRIRREKFL